MKITDKEIEGLKNGFLETVEDILHEAEAIKDDKHRAFFVRGALYGVALSKQKEMQRLAKEGKLLQ
jgi:hypothetical protein